MKTLIVYCSTYKNNTEKIAEVFAKKINADLMNIKNFRETDIDGYDLIGFGSGVYRESLAPQVFNCIGKLNLEGRNVFVFSTSGVGLAFYNKKLIKLLESKGAICRGSFACRGSFVSKDFSNNKIFEIMSKFAEGHPDNKDFNKAGQFIANVII